MSQWTYIIGRIVVSPLGYSHEQRLNTLKNIISTLPSVTGSEGNMQITFNQSDEEYVLKIKGGLRDRQTEQTVKEYEKFICNLKQKIDVEKVYVEIEGQDKKFIDKGRNNMKKLKVISLFSGIGAQERGLQELNIDYELLNFCEFDETKAKAYSLLHAEPVEKNLWDITKVDLNTIKQSDLVIYSPPCQSWSVAGKKKGINDIRGTLFWNALDIIKKSNPKYAIMENVNNLPERFTSDFEEMLKCLDNTGYNNYWQIINARDFIPQNRKRVFIVSIRKDIDAYDFKFPVGTDNTNWWDFIDPMDTRECTCRQKRMIDFALGKNTSDNIKIEGAVSFDNSIILLRQSGLRFYNNREHPTLCATMGKGGGNFTILTHQGHYGGIKPRACFKLMGFTYEDCDMLEKNGFSTSNLYIMAGDSVVVPVIREIERNLLLVEGN